MAQTFVVLVALAAVFVYVAAFIRVGQMRAKHNIKAPAMTGHIDFEKAYRVQMNTLEQLVPMLVGLAIYSVQVSAMGAAILGGVWVVGRIIYMVTYYINPDRRAAGFLISGVATICLIVGSAMSLIQSLFAAG